MADISVDGWVAEGGYSIIEGKKNNILLFDIVENNTSVGGIGDDEFRTNHAWFHCCFEINIEDPSEVSFIPEGYTLDRICSSGWAWIKKKGADKWLYTGRKSRPCQWAGFSVKGPGRGLASYDRCVGNMD